MVWYGMGMVWCSNPPPLYKLRKNPKLIRPYAHCSLDKAVDARVQKEKIAR